MGGILITTDKDSIILKKYWLDIILVQTKQYLTKEELCLDDIDNLYYWCEFFYMYLNFNKRDINEESFLVFYKRCLQAYIDYPETDAAKAHYVDFRSTFKEERNIFKDYTNPEIINKLIDHGRQQKYFDSAHEGYIDFQSYLEIVLHWWKTLLDFLEENYGKLASPDI